MAADMRYSETFNIGGTYMSLNGRVALVTGGGKGIGGAISLALSKVGADIVINYSRSENEAVKIADLIRDSGAKAEIVQADVGDTSQCKQLVRRSIALFGKVDILVSNAGVGQPDDIVDATDEEWDRVMNINARATFALARELLPSMMERKFGRVVTISSNVAAYGRGGASGVIYAASKAALIAVTKCIAHEGGPYITANVICPGPTDRHPEHDRREPIKVDETRQRIWLGIKYLTGRSGVPEDIAHAVSFFAAEEAGDVTGQTLHVSGGLILP